MSPAEVRVDDVSWAPARLTGVTLRAGPGEVVGLLGPNGSGKSSLLRCVYRRIRPDRGAVLLDGTDVWRSSAGEVARQVAAVTQDVPGDLDTTAAQVVALGRLPFLGALGRLGAGDRALVHEALERCGAAGLAHRRMATLSGGERQRVQVARALAQRPRLLVLDEPTNHLDLHHQVALFGLLADLDATVLVALHDLQIAAAACDRVAVLDRGALVAEGTPRDVLTEDLLAAVYRVDADVTESKDGTLRIGLRVPRRNGGAAGSCK